MGNTMILRMPKKPRIIVAELKSAGKTTIINSISTMRWEMEFLTWNLGGSGFGKEIWKKNNPRLWRNHICLIQLTKTKKE